MKKYIYKRDKINKLFYLFLYKNKYFKYRKFLINFNFILWFFINYKLK